MSNKYKYNKNNKKKLEIIKNSCENMRIKVKCCKETNDITKRVLKTLLKSMMLTKLKCLKISIKLNLKFIRRDILEIIYLNKKNKNLNNNWTML